MLSIFKHDISACRCNFWEVLYVTLESWARGRCYDGIWGEGCLRGTIACKGEPLRAGGEAGRSSAALLQGDISSRVGPRRATASSSATGRGLPQSSMARGGNPCGKGADGGWAAAAAHVAG